MKKIAILILMCMVSGFTHAQTIDWSKSLNEEESFVAAGATKYFTVSKTPYNNRVYTVRSFNSSGTALLATTILPISPYTVMNIVKVIATPSDDLFILTNVSDGSVNRAFVIRLNGSLLQPWANEIILGTKTYAKDMAIKGSQLAVLTSFYATPTSIKAGISCFNISTGSVAVTFASPFEMAPLQITTDGNQNVYICGGSELTINLARVVKLNSSLIVLWNVTTNLSTYTNALMPFRFIQLDVSGNVYVGGNGFNSTYSVWRTEIRKYNASGTLLNSYNSTNFNSNKFLRGMKINLAGNVYIATQEASTVTTYSNYLIYKLTSALTHISGFTTSGTWPQHSSIALTGFEVTQSGSVFLTASRNGGTSSTNNYLTFKLKNDFTFQFAEILNSSRCNAMVKAIAGSYPNDEFVTTGVVSNINRLVKYTGPGARTASETETTEPTLPKPLCYPNPATTEISFSGINEATEITLFDMTGKKVLQQFINPNEKTDVNFLPRGIYFIKTDSGHDIIGPQKLILK